MITVTNLALAFGKRVLFKDVNLKFTSGNCYGIIGANGSGKSTFLKLLAGEIEADRGSITRGAGERIAVLNQDRFAFEEHPVMETVVMGWPRLHAVTKEREALYARSEFSEADGIRASELEAEFAELGGWEAESQAASLLAGLGVAEEFHGKLMREVTEGVKVRVLLAQALFGSPDILLLDEPTNGLDLDSIDWLEEFLIASPDVVIVVSHDRHFLNSVATHTCDIDYGAIRLYPGNYDFWYHMNRLLQQQKRDEKKRREDRARDLREFIQRFSSNAAKSKQATSRKKVLEKLEVDDYVSSSRRFPYVGFRPEREVGNNVLTVSGLRATVDGRSLLGGIDLTVNRLDKIAFVGREHQAKTAFFRIIALEDAPESGEVVWGQTTSRAYFPRDNTGLFESDLSLVEWLRQWSSSDDETFLRSFLGRMLFSGDEALKSVRVLSGGEKVRCLLARLMLSGANCLILDEPTNHLDLESITALNDGLVEFPGVVLFSSHDHEFVSTVANRIVELCPGGMIDRSVGFEEFHADTRVAELRDRFYHAHVAAEV